MKEGKEANVAVMTSSRYAHVPRSRPELYGQYVLAPPMHPGSDVMWPGQILDHESDPKLLDIAAAFMGPLEYPSSDAQDAMWDWAVVGYFGYQFVKLAPLSAIVYIELPFQQPQLQPQASLSVHSHLQNGPASSTGGGQSQSAKVVVTGNYDGVSLPAAIASARAAAQKSGNLTLFDCALASVEAAVSYVPKWYRVLQPDGVLWPAQYVKRPDFDLRLPPSIHSKKMYFGDKFCVAYGGHLSFEWVEKSSVIKYKSLPTTTSTGCSGSVGPSAPREPQSATQKIQWEEGYHQVDQGHDLVALFSMYELLKAQRQMTKNRAGKKRDVREMDLVNVLRFEDAAKKSRSASTSSHAD
eukprot:ANDGO_06610.mRNA.1 hypothetical protein